MLNVSLIQEMVATNFGTTVKELIGRSKHRVIIRARHIAMYLSRKLTKLSYPQIGRKFDNRDHSTIIHGVQRIAAKIRKDPHFEQFISNLTLQMTKPANLEYV